VSATRSTGFDLRQLRARILAARDRVVRGLRREFHFRRRPLHAAERPERHTPGLMLHSVNFFAQN
jgi:hypothetical protein